MSEQYSDDDAREAEVWIDKVINGADGLIKIAADGLLRAQGGDMNTAVSRQKQVIDTLESTNSTYLAYIALELALRLAETSPEFALRATEEDEND